MSAFLGPIHYWLFNKIQFQNKLTDKIINSYENKNQITQTLKNKYGELEKEPLEDIIDESNIHGWLQKRVSLVEYRYADAVTAIIKNSDSHFQTLEKLCFEFGSENKPKETLDSHGLFEYLNNILLDGMPCDCANDVISEDENSVIWRRNLCVHKKYWDELGGDIDNYYLLRDSLIKGILEGTGFVYEKADENKYTIRKL